MKFLVRYNINFWLAEGGTPPSSPVAKTLAMFVKSN